MRMRTCRGLVAIVMTIATVLPAPLALAAQAPRPSQAAVAGGAPVIQVDDRYWGNGNRWGHGYGHRWYRGPGHPYYGRGYGYPYYYQDHDHYDAAPLILGGIAVLGTIMLLNSMQQQNYYNHGYYGR